MGFCAHLPKYEKQIACNIFNLLFLFFSRFSNMQQVLDYSTCSPQNHTKTHKIICAKIGQESEVCAKVGCWPLGILNMGILGNF